METGHGEGEAWVPVGIGVHTGLFYVGYIGEGDALDFTALGDTVNTAARLTSMAKAWRDRHQRRGGGRRARHVGARERTLDLRGREQTVDAWVQLAMSSVATTAA